MAVCLSVLLVLCTHPVEDNPAYPHSQADILRDSPEEIQDTLYLNIGKTNKQKKNIKKQTNKGYTHRVICTF